MCHKSRALAGGAYPFYFLSLFFFLSFFFPSVEYSTGTLSDLCIYRSQTFEPATLCRMYKNTF